jgi:hypothetical protein
MNGSYSSGTRYTTARPSGSERALQLLSCGGLNCGGPFTGGTGSSIGTNRAALPWGVGTFKLRASASTLSIKISANMAGLPKLVPEMTGDS